MAEAKFPIKANPTGILFNPLSISEMITSLNTPRTYTSENLQSDGNLWFSWKHHGSFSDIRPEAALERINRAAAEGTGALRQADYVIITFGTA